MRCFLGLEIPAIANARLDLALAAAVRESPPARWVPAENRHLTLVFLGRLEPARLASLGEALGPLCAAGRPLSLAFSGGGVFPQGKRAKVVWVGLRPSPRLSRLQSKAADACANLGFRIDRRAFVPHLTVARCRPPWPVGAGESWQRRCDARLRAGADDSFEVSRAALFESRPRPGGVRYRVVQSYPLGSGALRRLEREASNR